MSWRIAAEKPTLLRRCAELSRSPTGKARAGWRFGLSTPWPVDTPISALREQLGDLLETIPSGHDLPAFRAATGLLNESG